MSGLPLIAHFILMIFIGATFGFMGGFMFRKKDEISPVTEQKGLLLQYVDLVHKYQNRLHPKVLDFIDDHIDDALFLTRVRKFNTILDLRDADPQILKEVKANRELFKVPERPLKDTFEESLARSDKI